MWFKRSLFFNYFMIVEILILLFASCDGETYGSYLDVVPRKFLSIIGHQMCKALCKQSGTTLCASYNFDSKQFTCSLNTEDSSTATLMPGSNVWYGESSNIPNTYAGACSAVSCGSRERCVVLRSKRAKCVTTECADPPTIPNGVATAGKKRVKTVRSYTCNTGYDLVGSGNITCKANGQWQTPTFSCDIADCGTPPSVTNADTSAGGSTFGSTTTYTCHLGYDTSGTTTISCQADGTWTAVGITCTIQDCGTPNNLPNAALSAPSTTYNSIATYTCNTGYDTINGPCQITCLAGPTWESIPCSCQIQDCGQPQSLINSAAPTVTATTYLGTATYTCDTGYSLTGVGNGVITCQAGPVWDSINFECTLDDCGPPPQPANINLPPSYTTTTYQSVVIYTCITGYSMTTANDQITCLAGATWSNILFACNIQDCGTPSTLSNAIFSAPTTTYLSTATYTCNSGYDMVNGNGQITCQVGPAWDTISFSCRIQDCGTPSTITDGTRSYTSTTYLSTTSYSCNTGYTLNGGNTATCQAGATWGPIPSCQLQDCGAPSTIANGARSFSTTTYLSTATYSCNSGYTLSGGSQVTCQAGGTWGSVPSCSPQDCGNPSTIANGARSYTTTTYLSTVTYSCNSGYTLSGGSQVTCQAGGTWGSIPSCSPQDCGNPPTIANGVRSYTTTTYLSTATYSCNSGYTLSGGSQVTCQAGGTWGSIPSCVSQECPTQPTVFGAIVTGTGNQPGNTRTYTCDDGYVVSGISPEIITCSNAYTWPTPSLTCSACSTYATTYVQRQNKFFNPPVSFTPSISGGIDAAYCKTACNDRSDFVCKAMYYRKSTGGYCILRPQRIHDSSSYPSYYNTDSTYDEYIRDCLVLCPEPPTSAGATVTGSGLTPGSTRSYTCNDPGYPSGTTTLTCQSNGQWSPTSDFSCSCSSYASTYTQIPNKFFNPPVSFTPSISGGIDAAYCRSACNTRSDFVCVAMYYRKSTGGYCILRPQRVNDNPSYPQYYNDDTTYDEYIRDCNA